MKFQIFLLLWSLFCLQLMGQNLIPNPGFEEYTSCPTDHSSPHDPIKTKKWFSPTLGTPDLFSDCAFNTVSVPSNFAGFAYPADGHNYAGMYMGNPTQTVDKCYREYLTCRLIEKLKKDEVYELTFFAKPASYSYFSVKHLSFALTDTIIEVEHDNLYRLPFEKVLTDTLEVIHGWYKIHMEITANGDESNLTIGDFIPPEEGYYEEMNKSYSSPNEGGGISYFLFDNFSLAKKHEPYIVNQPFALEKLYFEFDSFDLNNAASEELNLLSSFLNENPHLSLNIYGNADKAGNETYNEELSLKRALTVKERLIELGINTDRIKAFNNGERKIISPIDSLNRRTEFLIYDGDEIKVNTENSN